MDMMKRVWENEPEYMNHPEISPWFDDDCEEFFKLIPVVDETEPRMDKSNFVYPELVKKKILFAEDIEEAIIQYLIRDKYFNEDELRNSYFSFEDTNGVKHTSQILRIFIGK
jgi:hypothetical protein